MKTNSQNLTAVASRLLFVMLLSFANSCWSADEPMSFSEKSGSVAFSGEHAGMAFSGEFTRWRAQILLPPAKDAFVTAKFDMSNASTGNAMYDETLPEGDWFDVDNHPESSFESKMVKAQGEGFLVTGDLTLRGKAQPVSFVLSPTKNGWQAEFSIDRLAFDIGRDSDESAEWVSQNIDMEIKLGR